MLQRLHSLIPFSSSLFVSFRNAAASISHSSLSTSGWRPIGASHPYSTAPPPLATSTPTALRHSRTTHATSRSGTKHSQRIRLPLPTAYSSRYLVARRLDLLFLLIAFRRASTAQCIHPVCSSRSLSSHVYCLVDKIIPSNGYSFNLQSLSFIYDFFFYRSVIALKSASCF